MVSVAAATVDTDRQNQSSLPRLGTDALIVPALKSRAKLTWSLPRPGKMWLRYFFKVHKTTEWLENISSSRQRRLNSIVADATGNENRAHHGLQPTAKFNRRSAAGRSTFLLTSLFCLLAACAISVRAQDADYQNAVSLVQQGQFDRACPLLQRILDRSPNDLKARNLMGIALSAAGRREEANEHFKKVLALEPKFVPALKNLALNELALGK
ncbi:MAG TPA: tetratricopeptide repeat protein, partial [Blastocatellia bacterium]|nr:tetratricopeptide repeat protein [Blastocatellia bacterium]